MNFQNFLVNLCVSQVRNCPRLFQSLRKLRNAMEAFSFSPVEGFYDQGGIGWAAYMLTHNMPEMVANLRSGLDAKSNELLDFIFQRMVIFPEGSYRNYRIRKSYLRSPLFQTQKEAADEKLFSAEFESYRKDYLLDEANRIVDTFMYHNGLRNKSEKLKEYISGKDFIDGGAYIGDSALLYIKKYNPRRVYSFEISAKTCIRYEAVMQMNRIPVDKYKLVPMGLSEKKTGNRNSRHR